MYSNTKQMKLKGKITTTILHLSDLLRDYVRLRHHVNRSGVKKNGYFCPIVHKHCCSISAQDVPSATLKDLMMQKRN